MFDSDKTGSSLTQQKSERIRRVLHSCIVRRQAGEVVLDQELADHIPDLEPELGERLRGPQLIESALSEADQQGRHSQTAFHLQLSALPQPDRGR